MKNECSRNGIFPNSFKSISSYLKIVSSGASSVASTAVRSAASVASSFVERDNETNHDQVYWAGFDKLELERGISQRVLLLGYSYGFEVWDVEFADNVRNLVSRHDGPVSFMQTLPKPIISKQIMDKFFESHPLLIICADGSFSGGDNVQEGSGINSNGSAQQNRDNWVPTALWFYSLRSQSYVHHLRFRSVVHLVRCSPRVVAVLQSAQVHCFNTATLEREYTICTNPVATGCYGLGNIGFGPLAVGPRWMAYSGAQVAISNSGRVTPQHLTPSPSFSSSNGSSLVAHYAKESSKQIAAGLVTLGDIGYKKLSKYYSEFLPEENVNGQHGDAHLKTFSNGHLPHGDDVGMVIVRDIVSKAVIAQFRAHKSPISSLGFDPSGILLVTASVQGHNINVFRIMPGNSNSSSASGPSYVHIYRLQRGITNAVIQDISFSSDSKWIMISSSRGTSHLFAISPSGGVVSYQSSDSSFSTRNSGRAKHARLSNSGLEMLIQRSVCASGPTVTLSAVSRIRNGNSGRVGSLSLAIASSFHKCKGNSRSMHSDINSKEPSYCMLVFTPSGSLIQYGLHISPAFNGMAVLSGISTTCESDPDCDSRFVVEPLQKWNIYQKQNRLEKTNNIDLCIENGNSDSRKVCTESSTFFKELGTTAARKENVTTEERNHMYISAAELQMHQNPYPLWARSEISFQPMLTGGFNLEDGASEGEIEIEKIPVRKLVARSGELIPVFDYQALKHQEERIPISSSGSLNSVSNGGVDETWQYDIHLTTETSGGCVNTDDTPLMNTQLEIVNTRDNSVNGSQLRDVHDRDGLEMENQSSESG